MLTLAGTTLLYCSKEEAALWLSVYTVFFECCTAATCSVAVQLQLCIGACAVVTWVTTDDVENELTDEYC